MKIVIDIQQTKEGHVGITVEVDGVSAGTVKECAFAVRLKELVMRELPGIGAALGGKAFIASEGKPEHS